MEIEYTTDKEDIIAFNLYQNFQSPEGRKRKRNAVLGNTLAFFIALLVINIIAANWWISLGIAVVFSIPFAFFINWSLDRSVRGTVSKWLDSGKNTSLLCKHKLVLDEEGLIDTTDFGESRMRWGGMERVKQSDDYIFIYPSSMESIPLKKKLFDSESAAADFYNFAAEHIEKAQRTA